MSDKSWFDNLSEILSKPLPGTEQDAPRAAEKPVVFTDDDDDDSLLDKITDILSKPLPGTESTAPRLQPNHRRRRIPGESAVRDAEEPDADPVSTTAAAGADWMQREYERFNAHQEHSRQGFAEQQRVEQERFAAYQRAQLQQFMTSQERERGVFKHHQEARFQMWRHDLRHAYAPVPGMPPNAPPRSGDAATPAATTLVAQALAPDHAGQTKKGVPKRTPFMSFTDLSSKDQRRNLLAIPRISSIAEPSLSASRKPLSISTMPPPCRPAS